MTKRRITETEECSAATITTAAGTTTTTTTAATTNAAATNNYDNDATSMGINYENIVKQMCGSDWK